MVMGGAEIYRQTINRANRLEITHVHRTVEGDARFLTSTRPSGTKRPRGPWGFSFVTYVRA